MSGPERPKPTNQVCGVYRALLYGCPYKFYLGFGVLLEGDRRFSTLSELRLTLNHLGKKFPVAKTCGGPCTVVWNSSPWPKFLRHNP